MSQTAKNNPLLPCNRCNEQYNQFSTTLQGESVEFLSIYYHPDLEISDKTIIYKHTCPTCVADMDNNDLTTLDVMQFERVRMDYDKEYDYSE